MPKYAVFIIQCVSITLLVTLCCLIYRDIRRIKREMKQTQIEIDALNRELSNETNQPE